MARRAVELNRGNLEMAAHRNTLRAVAREQQRDTSNGQRVEVAGKRGDKPAARPGLSKSREFRGETPGRRAGRADGRASRTVGVEVKPREYGEGGGETDRRGVRVRGRQGGPRIREGTRGETYETDMNFERRKNKPLDVGVGGTRWCAGESVCSGGESTMVCWWRRTERWVGGGRRGVGVEGGGSRLETQVDISLEQTRHLPTIRKTFTSSVPRQCPSLYYSCTLNTLQPPRGAAAGV